MKTEAPASPGRGGSRPAVRVSPDHEAAALGATPTPDGVRFALFSTTARRDGVRLFAPGSYVVSSEHELVEVTPHRFEVEVAGIGPGALYKLVLDDQEVPDPYARFLPEGVHGPARVEALTSERRADFRSRPFARWVIYELHVGTFTSEGTYRAAMARLDHLVALGISAIEIMPLAAFAGSRGWGYDGVALYAPFAAYGEPGDLRAFVQAAHARGIAVLLDVVYNHFGPAGNYLATYAPEYLAAHPNAWGAAPSFAEPHLRRLVLDNARYWFEQFDFDGLRLDATHGIVDDSETHILAELAALAHAYDRPRILVAEDERNDPLLVEQYGLDAVWADDLHHALRVTLTGENDGYYRAYRGGAEELARTIARGWLYEGQVYAASGKPRGKPATLPKTSLVYCIQNHDQVGNRALGNRLSDDVSPEAYAGASLLLLFLPAIPLLFMGQEWGASSPFQFFTDHEPELGAAITKGRREEFKGFEAFQDPAVRDRIPDPQAPETFRRAKLSWEELARHPHAALLALYAKMIRLRNDDPVLSADGELTAAVEHGLLVVTRSTPAGSRVLLYNPTTDAISDARLLSHQVLVQSAPIADGALRAGAAAVLASL